jgi:hypothetical protein
MAKSGGAQHMAEAEQAGGRLSHGLARHLSIGIGSVTARIESLLAEPTLTTADREWNNDPSPIARLVTSEPSSITSPIFS